MITSTTKRGPSTLFCGKNPVIPGFLGDDLVDETREPCAKAHHLAAKVLDVAVLMFEKLYLIEKLNKVKHHPGSRKAQVRRNYLEN